MFDLGWPELLVVAIVLIVVVGPKDLPRVLRGFGRTTSKIRGMAGDFRKQFDEALREAELEDVQTLVKDARKLDPRREIKKHLSPLEEAGKDVRAGLDQAMKPKASQPKLDEGNRPAASDAVAKAPVKTGATAKSSAAGKATAKSAASAAKKAPSGSRSTSKTAAKPKSARAGGTKSATARPATTKKTGSGA
ncbi:Sec-independent protein translocase protein TatB [Nitratireductor basaltis]|uniref:Sec-independent protein translocase protein TatB n=1 Tax=Nitratireductor basaltis TaxID=472175 RepID=A0A084UA96_9HYPH|nr:Sec-independent protein translocase protein TatB [Nitratireductor basaltis]KFB09882.1 Sec-independent protein translocase protein TatB [Nitratireductor basaltis]